MAEKLALILSPSKLMNDAIPAVQANGELPEFLKQSESLVKELRTVSVSTWKQKMKITDELAQLTVDRFNQWSPTQIKKKGTPAAATFSGEAFKALQAASWNAKQWKEANDKLVVLSAVYGALKASDLMLPYRLMVGTPYKTQEGISLYQYWSKTVTDYFNARLGKNGVLLNLASDEYSKMIDRKSFQARWVDFKFLQKQSDGSLKNIATFSKQARGSVAKYVIENNIQSAEQAQQFNAEGYSFAKKLSSENEWVFVR
jgi:cytoplasmic iron level regulating protein YaaA (DUF328/UPF0246 family)